ncbi:pteridine-dependent deoxygenase [Arenimonas sp.]|uniref:chorismate transformation enzyme, FkbO/Hyg5 family n=1 Tax=Arenimonas sp. TaxID=1872635 RepID=UPI002E323975|nr:pteridine-dependent deoxygenase [Arenimonas sp.]HEX4854132.1 pteridine-dependent deoxygenase [Arenimonas sp.]
MNSPDPIPARLRIVPERRDEALIPFRFQSGVASPLAIECPPLAGPADEAWLAGAITESAETAGAAWAHGEHYALVALALDEAAGDIEAAAALAYERLLVAVRPSAHPYLLRIWNYFAAINQGEGDEERYRRFCVGRARAVDGMFNDPPPAATAIGTVGAPGQLKVVALCSRAPAIALENPRQTPAWQYPREHGPVSPGFSRGAILDADTATPRLLASGTASIVGHVSLHLGDCAEQLRESLRNLDALMAQAAGKTGHRFQPAGCEALRIYLRHAADLDAARAVMATTGIPADRISYLRGDVCRRELDVELEGVFAAT